MEKLLPGVKLQEIESELSSENGCILKRSKQWHRSTGRLHHLAKVSMRRCTCAVPSWWASVCMHSHISQPRKEENELLRDLPGKPANRRTRTLLLLSFLSSLPHQLPWQAPNLVNNSATSASKSLQLSMWCGTRTRSAALCDGMKASLWLFFTESWS